MRKKQGVIVALVAACIGVGVAIVWTLVQPNRQAPDGPAVGPPQQDNRFVGSVSCQECHAKFYTLWSKSNHGLAMQPFTPELAKAKLPKQASEVKIGDHTYRADFDNETGHVLEKGPDGEKRYPIAHVMGGKNGENGDGSQKGFEVAGSYGINEK